MVCQGLELHEKQVADDSKTPSDGSDDEEVDENDINGGDDQ